MDQSAKVVSAYLNDLSDAELLVRPVPGANHIAWQLGHLIASEHDLVSMIAPGMMPPLPDGFKERHKKEHSKLDDPQHFFKKEEYVRLLKQQREGTLAVLARQSDSDLDKPAPEPLRGLLRTVGEVFVLLGSHPMMHAGQWAVTRRKLGRPPLF
jgi:uncharacterized damage-inducible protein DinB